MKRILLRAFALSLCMLLTASWAMAEDVRFRFHAEAELGGEEGSSGTGTLSEALNMLLTVSTLEGEFHKTGDGFLLDASLLMGDGRNASHTDVSVFGADSHWGIRSSLLGATELMVNNSALLAFGCKARDWYGIPLDKAALLLPYTHENALSGPRELLAPLFPEETGSRTLSRAEIDELGTELIRLCDEDAAFNRWLEVTGLYKTAVRYIRRVISLPPMILPSVTVTRTEGELRWTVLLVELLSIRETESGVNLKLSIPTIIQATASMTKANGRFDGSLSINMDDEVVITGSCALPADPDCSMTISAVLDAKAPFLPEDGMHLLIEGEMKDGSVVLRQVSPKDHSVLMTVRARVEPAEYRELPDCRPEALAGVNILSINSESLRRLMADVQDPLLSGILDLVVAAPAPAVQSLMDAAEDSGLLDLLTDSISGGTGY